MLVGRDAERGARREPSRLEPNPKRRVDDGHVLLGGRQYPVAHLVGGVLRRVADEAARVAGRLPDRVVLSHPANWGAPRIRVVRDAATNAGLSGVTLIPEPVAAALYFSRVLGHAVPDGAALLVYDFGGGTFDTTVLRSEAGGWRVLATDGLPDVGGLDLDAAIVDHVRATLRPEHHEQWVRLLEPADDPGRRRNRMLWEDVRAAKEQLSRSSSAGLLVPVLDVDVHLTRDEFERLARPSVERTVEVAAGALQRAGVRPDQLAGVFLVGGSSRIPMVGTALHHRIGVAPTVIEQPELVVALGSLVALGSPVALDPAGYPRPAESVPAAGSPGTPARKRPYGLVLGAAGLVIALVVGGVAYWSSRGDDTDPNDGGTSRASARPGGPYQELTIGKSAWYGPLKITFGKLVYDKTKEDQLTVETVVENEGPESFSPRLTMTFTLDGVQNTVSSSSYGNVTGKQRTRVTYTVRKLDVPGTIADGVFTIGDGDEAQAVVPAGPKGRLVSYEPRRVLTKDVVLKHRDLTVTVHSCDVRGGFFDFNGQADSGYQALTCVVDAQYTGGGAAGHYFGRDNVVLVDPAGLEAGSTPQVNEALYGPEVHRNVRPGFLVKNPARGRYLLRIVDVHAGETRSATSVKDLELTL
ncbi:Hsp70 family protein [Cryptosporangium sp. NPDC051539]|uniref:Hsp70 family protein n=1 Tax=Cryptosporangium sp. NPDC051539 TaxID=3363962 RepID=UPI0037A9C80D